MPLVDSLLTAVVRSDGDALVLHVGEKPYVVAATGPVELSRQGLGLGAMEGMLAQLLTADALRTLREMGAVEHELDDRPAASGDRFTVVAARGGDDIWIELRRHRRVATPAPAARPAPAEVEPARASTPAAPAEAPSAEPSPAVVPGAEPAPPVAAAPVTEVEPVVESAPAPVAAPEVESPVLAVVETSADALPELGGDVYVIDVPVPAIPELQPDLAMAAVPAHEPAATLEAAPAPEPVLESPAPAPAAAVSPAPEPEPVEPTPAPAPAPEPAPPVTTAAPAVPEPMPVTPVAVAAPVPPAAAPEPAPEVLAVPVAEAAAEAPHPAAAAAPVSAPRPVAVPEAGSDHHEPAAAWSAPAPRIEAPEPHYVPESHPMLPGLASELDAMGREAAASVLDAADQLPAVVLSLTRDGARGSGPGTRGTVRPGGIERLLRLAAARGASALYLTTQARPAVRVDGDIRLLDGEPALSSGDVEAAVLELAPEGARDKESAEWIRDLADVGRVRITTFRDYRGPGALLRMIQARATSAEQLGLVREIQALATEPEGLVIVTGPRASGKSTLVSAFVDLINRQRNDYVITLEGQIRLVHESRGSLISQRELRGNAQEVVSAARAALRENPDVLVIEDLRSPDVLQVALDAAGSGLLVFASVTAASATAALERLVDLCPSEQRRTVRAALAEHLRGVVAQVLLRKAGGGRLAARELVLNTNAVAALISDGQIAQLPRAIDSGRKLGMAPLNDALVAFVQSGAVDVREAYRKADDKTGLLALLRREGIDTSFVERLA